MNIFISVSRMETIECTYVCIAYRFIAYLGLAGGVFTGEWWAKPVVLPAEFCFDNDQFDAEWFVRGGEHPKYIADPFSVADKSTRDPWTDGGAEPGT